METQSCKNPADTPRASAPDAETSDRIYLIKNVSRLHATYQVRQLAFLARLRGKKLILVVPPFCRFEPGLEALISAHPGILDREDLP